VTTPSRTNARQRVRACARATNHTAPFTQLVSHKSTPLSVVGANGREGKPARPPDNEG
jgi:hypothetical protein